MTNQLDIVLTGVIQAVPGILGGLIILFVGWLAARGVRRLARRILQRTDLDNTVANAPGGRTMTTMALSPTRIISTFLYWMTLFGAASLAVSVLGISALTQFMAAIYTYLPNVAAAVLILFVSINVSMAASRLIGRSLGETPTGKLLSGIVPGVILSVAGFMILSQLQIAPAIVLITYTALIGGLALGSALAFGLGGRDVAARMMQQAYYRGTERVEQLRLDLAQNQHQVEVARQSTPAPVQDVGRPATASGRLTTAFGESLESFKRPEPKVPTDLRHPDSSR